MVGVGLSRLWGTHPRLAFVLHLLVTLILGGFALSFVLAGTGWATILVTGIGFLLMAASLVFLTWYANKNHWQPDDYSYGSQLPSPRAAWGNAQALERVLWVLFAAAFLLGWVLLSAGSGFGVALVVLSLPLAFVAMRVGK
jgi:hypothetical protein